MCALEINLYFPSERRELRPPRILMLNTRVSDERFAGVFLPDPLLLLLLLALCSLKAHTIIKYMHINNTRETRQKKEKRAIQQSRQNKNQINRKATTAATRESWSNFRIAKVNVREV